MARAAGHRLDAREARAHPAGVVQPTRRAGEVEPVRGRDAEPGGHRRGGTERPGRRPPGRGAGAQRAYLVHADAEGDRQAHARRGHGEPPSPGEAPGRPEGHPQAAAPARPARAAGEPAERGADPRAPAEAGGAQAHARARDRGERHPMPAVGDGEARAHAGVRRTRRTGTMIRRRPARTAIARRRPGRARTRHPDQFRERPATARADRREHPRRRAARSHVPTRGGHRP